jgi:hypothetical protein
MLRSFTVGLVFLTLSAGLASQSAQQEVMKAEETRLEARRNGNSATLTRLASDDQLTVGPNGQLQDKKATAALTAVPKASVHDVKTQMFGDIAVVSGMQAGFGERGDIEQRFTRIWRRQDRQWVNVFGHVTRATSAAPAAAAPTHKPVPQTVWPKGASADEGAVLEVHRRLDEAFQRKDVPAYSALTAANWVRLNSDGGQTSREAFLKTVAGTPELKRVVPNHSEFHLRVYGPVAVVTYRAKTSTGGDLRRSRVFVKDGAAWKQLISQETDLVQQ